MGRDRVTYKADPITPMNIAPIVLFTVGCCKLNARLIVGCELVGGARDEGEREDPGLNVMQISASNMGRS